MRILHHMLLTYNNRLCGQTVFCAEIKITQITSYTLSSNPNVLFCNRYGVIALTVVVDGPVGVSHAAQSLKLQSNCTDSLNEASVCSFFIPDFDKTGSSGRSASHGHTRLPVMSGLCLFLDPHVVCSLYLHVLLMLCSQVV